MTAGELLAALEKEFVSRKFSAGLLVAFIDFLLKLDIQSKSFKSLADVLVSFPRQSQTGAGKKANTLIVALPDGGTLSLRPFYNEVERFFRAEHKRFDYPSCAPHATQAWGDYLEWLDALVVLPNSRLIKLRKKVCDFVLTSLKNQAFVPASVRTEAPLLRLILEGFEMSAPRGSGEASGSALQGAVFGFLRADNPHLQIEIDKVRTGSKRLQRIGDIDGWDGSHLALSAEVKQFAIKLEDIQDLSSFAHETSIRGALGIVAALAFKPGARAQLEALGLKVLDIDDMIRIVELWDPLKQRTAASSFVYYARHVEKSSSLGDRLEAFLKQAQSVDF